MSELPSYAHFVVGHTYRYADIKERLVGWNIQQYSKDLIGVGFLWVSLEGGPFFSFLLDDSDQGEIYRCIFTGVANETRVEH